MSHGAQPDIAVTTYDVRAWGALVGLAIGDALGAPVEFQRRGSFEPVTDMMSGGYFRLPAGAWTDDTAQAICLANSLLENPDFSAGDFLDRLWGWMERGENTSTGIAIGVGQNTLRVMGNYRRTGALVAPRMPGKSDGNGALMRLAPVASMHWRDSVKACQIASAQSRATHHSDLSAACCELLAAILSGLIAGQSWDEAIDLATGFSWPEAVTDIARGGWRGKPAEDISSTGFVVHTLEAAIWSVGTTDSFEAALVRAVNLGDDADTVGAVAGQIAGARYGLGSIPERWLSSLAKADDLSSLAGRLIANR